MAGVWQYSSAEHLVPSKLRNNFFLYKLLAECIGTCLIVVFGVGSVCSAVVAESMSGLWQVATVWGFGVAFAIYVTAPVSGAHLNPAISLGLAILRPKAFAWSNLLPYWAAQYLGGILGGLINYITFSALILKFEKNLINKKVSKLSDEAQRESILQFRTSRDGKLSAMIFGEYFPDPTLGILKSEIDSSDLKQDLKEDANLIAPWYALLVEAWGTAILMFMILLLTDKRQDLVPKQAAPFFIGFTVAVLISLYAPLTQAGWNPARDFGPRLVAAALGWRQTAIPGPNNGFWIYIVGPMIGAPLGGLFFDLFIGPGLTLAQAEQQKLIRTEPA